MIKVKISELINSTEALQKLANTKLKAKLAWQVARLLKTADLEIQIFNDTRMNLIKKYADVDEDGEIITDEKGNCKISADNVTQFNTELSELLDTVIEMNVSKVSIDDLDNADFTPAEMNTLETFIDFGEDE